MDRIGADGETTVVAKDTLDNRLVSPFRHEVPCVIEVNADNGINRLTDLNEIMAPSALVYFIIY